MLDDAGGHFRGDLFHRIKIRVLFLFWLHVTFDYLAHNLTCSGVVTWCGHMVYIRDASLSIVVHQRVKGLKLSGYFSHTWLSLHFLLLTVLSSFVGIVVICCFGTITNEMDS